MCAPAVLTLAAGAFTAWTQYQGGKAQNSYYQYLAGQSKLEGKAALTQSAQQASLIQESASIENKQLALKTAEVTSAQKAAMAASGVDLSSVSAQDIAISTLTKAKMDEMMVRRNANLNAWSALEEGKQRNWQAKVQADQYSYAGKAAKYAGKVNAFATLLSTASAMAGGQMFASPMQTGTLTTGASFSRAPYSSNAASSSWLRSMK